jgi:hypothetical protein
MCYNGKHMYVMFAVKRPIQPANLSREKRAVFEWCMDQFGAPTRRRWKKAQSMLGFRNEEDAVAFKIRWG